MAKFTLSKAEYIDASWPLFKKSFIVRCLIIFLAVFYGFKNLGFGLTVINGSVALLILAIAVWFIKYFWKRRTAKLFDDEASFSSPTSMEVSDESFKMENSRGTATIKWSEVKKCIKSKGFYLLFTSKRFAIIVPQRSLSAIEDEMFQLKLNLA